MAILDMQTIRYLNLLDKITHVKTSKCYTYNNTIVFAVPRRFVAQAIGEGAVNIKRIQEQMGKRVRIIGESQGTEDMHRFISDLVSPTTFKGIAVQENTLTITSGTMQQKALLLGRNKTRFEELELVVKDTYGLALKIM
jgi:transcription antitermination factor NusA-like protein